MQPFVAVLSNGKIVVPTQSEADSLYNDGYGARERNNPLVLEPYEALYNVERRKISVVDEESNEKLVFKDLLVSLTEQDPLVWTRFVVYRDLRTRGFVAKKGDADADFTVYERGAYHRQPPSYLVRIISEGHPQSVQDVISSLKKTEERRMEMKLAVVDRRGEIVYYGLSERRF